MNSIILTFYRIERSWVNHLKKKEVGLSPKGMVFV